MTDALLLREQDRQEILRLLARHLPDVAAWAYGSRVNGGAHEGSDLDIVLRSPDLSPIPLEELRAFAQALRDSNIPILVEARDWARLPESFQHEIMKNYVVLRETVSEWRQCRLGDAPFEIIDGDRGKNYPSQNEFFDNGHCVFLNTKNVTSSGFSFSELNFITKEKEEALRKGKLKRGDLVLTTRGTVGNIDYYNDSVVYDHVRINSGMVIIRPEGIDQRFNYQLFKHLKDQFDVFASGSAQPQLPIKDMKQIEVNLPPLPEQKAIASVLSSLDDKIDLLHRQNKTLEAMAEALFKQWFVEEVGEEWKEGCLGDFAVNVTKSAKVADIKSDDVYVGLEHIERRNISLVKNGSGVDVESNKYCFKKMDILFGKLRPYFHKVCFAPFDGICSTDILVIRPKKKHLFGYCLFAFFQNDVVEYANLGSGGTRMPRTNWETLSQYPVAVPDESKLIKFNEIAQSFIEKIEQNQKQIRTLEKLRDTLLPKLMSGEVRVAC